MENKSHDEIIAMFREFKKRKDAVYEAIMHDGKEFDDERECIERYLMQRVLLRSTAKISDLLKQRIRQINNPEL
jgi:hypothetical protein